MALKLIVLLLVTCAVPLEAADILVNSNFAEGRAHWLGDAQDLDDSSQADLTTGNSSSSGVVINLKTDKWTKICQAFDVRDELLYYSITFKLSADYKIASPSDNLSSRPDFSDIPGMGSSGALQESLWAFFIRGADGNPTGYGNSLHVDASKPSPQTVTGETPVPAVGRAYFLVAFPPGEGSITLLNISLSPDKPNSG